MCSGASSGSCVPMVVPEGTWNSDELRSNAAAAGSKTPAARAPRMASAIGSIYDGLHWVGISWDEGPHEGGPHAPYVQSERLPLYQGHAQELIAKDAAYYCFCSKERLAALRAEQEAKHELTRYDRHCRFIPVEEAAERAKNEPP